MVSLVEHIEIGWNWILLLVGLSVIHLCSYGIRTEIRLSDTLQKSMVLIESKKAGREVSLVNIDSRKEKYSQEVFLCL